MYPLGILLLVITLIFMIVPIIFQNKLRVFLNKNYIIVSLFALFCWLYFIFCRYLYNIVEYIQTHDEVSEIRYGQLLSKLFLLDMCPLMAFLLPLVSMFKKTRNIALILCPITIIGSSITIFGQLIWTSPEEADISQFFEFFFVGMWPNRMYFMMHFLTLILAIIILIVNYRFNWHHVIFTLLFYFVWIFYVDIIVVTLNIKANASGLVEFDWLNPYGQYHKVYLFWPLPFPYIAVFWYFVILIVNGLIIIANNFFTKRLDAYHIKRIYYQDNVNYWKLIRNRIMRR